MIFDMCIQGIVEHTSCKFHWNRTYIYCVRDFWTWNWGIWEIKFQTKQVHGSIWMQRSFKVEEWNVSIRWSLLGHPIDNEHGDDSYVLSGGLMLEECHSHLVNQKRKSATLRTIVLALFDYRLMKHHKFSITLQSERLLGQSKLSRLLTTAGPWYSVRDMTVFRPQ